MTQEEFNDVFETQMKKCSDILAHKLYRNLWSSLLLWLEQADVF